MNKLLLLSAGCAAMLLTTFAQAQEGDAEAGQAKAATCVACHGAEGVSTNPEWPNLAGQGAGYLHKQLVAFKNPGEPNGRVNPTMNGMAAPLSEQDMADLAAFYASKPVAFSEGDPAVVKTDLVDGETLYRGGDLSKGVAACAACHGTSGLGNPAAMFPALAGQHATYTIAQLKAFRSGERANDNGRMMRDIASRLTDAQMEAVAQYIQGLRPAE